MTYIVINVNYTFLLYTEVCRYTVTQTSTTKLSVCDNRVIPKPLTVPLIYTFTAVQVTDCCTWFQYSYFNVNIFLKQYLENIVILTISCHFKENIFSYLHFIRSLIPILQRCQLLPKFGSFVLKPPYSENQWGVFSIKLKKGLNNG